MPDARRTARPIAVLKNPGSILHNFSHLPIWSAYPTFAYNRRCHRQYIEERATGAGGFLSPPRGYRSAYISAERSRKNAWERILTANERPNAAVFAGAMAVVGFGERVTPAQIASAAAIILGVPVNSRLMR